MWLLTFDGQVSVDGSQGALMSFTRLSLGGEVECICSMVLLPLDFDDIALGVADCAIIIPQR